MIKSKATKYVPFFKLFLVLVRIKRKQTTAIHILHNISRGNDNQIMKLCQLIECNMGNIFLEKLYTKFHRETIPRSFSKKSRLSISLLLYVQVEIYQNKLKLRLWTLSFILHNTFLKNKKSSGASLPSSSSAWFLNKNISHAISYWLTKFHCLTAFTSGEMYIVIICCPVCEILKLTTALLSICFST